MNSKEWFWYKFPHMFFDMAEGKQVTIAQGVKMSMKRVLPDKHLFDNNAQFFVFGLKKEGYKQLEIVISSGITTDEKLIMQMYWDIARDVHTTFVQYIADIESGNAKEISDGI